MFKVLIMLLLLIPAAWSTEPSTPAEGGQNKPTTKAVAEEAAAKPQEDSKSDDEEVFEIYIYEISSVSKKAEPLWEAPGVASAVGVTEIEAFGAASVGEIWNYLPGVQNSFGTGINRTSIRGGDPNASAFHTLVLIDGRPVRASGGNIASYSPPYTFPTLQIDHMEVNRGPGSVMHGTNAFEGVLNIVTKKDQGNSFRALFEGGSFGTQKAEVAGSYQRGDFSIDGGLLFHDADGWGFESAAVSGGTFSKDVLQENRGLNLHVNYKNFNWSVFHGDMRQFALLALVPEDPLFFESQVTMMDFSYHHLVGTWKLEYHLTQNHEVFDWVFGETPVFPLHTNDWLGEVTAFGMIGDVDVTIGGTIQRLDAGTNGGVVSTPYQGQTDVYSLYTQVKYQVNDQVDLTAGLQINQIDNVDATVAGQPAVVPESLDADIVPRLGVIWNLNPNSDGPKNGFKFLYGEAFRSPSLLEYVIDTPGIQRGNPTLAPETIKTWDLQFFSRGSNYEFSLATYNSTQEDLIIFVRNEDYSLGQAANVAELDQEGVELESKYKPNGNWFASFSYTWQDNEEKSGLSQASLLPNTNYKLGVGYSSDRFNVSLFNQHDGAYQEMEPAPPFLNPPAKAVDIVTLNADFKLLSIARGNRMNMNLSARANNVLDEEIWIPDFLAGAANTVPGGPGRSFFATLRISM